MAIYYINPHTTVNGTGTFASPYSMASLTRTAVVAGDEFRILGVALTSLLTATVYTATNPSGSSFTITAGGGLGADWAQGDTLYLPAYDTFATVHSVSGNVLTLNSFITVPIPNTSVATGITVRRVNRASHGVSTNVTQMYVAGAVAVDNVTVSDCWINATTRVTDGTVKTLLTSSFAGAVQCFLDTSASATIGGWVMNLQNTHIMCGRAATQNAATLQLTIRSSNTAYNINQLYTNAGSTAVPTFILSTGFSANPINLTVNLVNNTTNLLIGTANSFSTNSTFNITNFYCNTPQGLFGNATNLLGNHINLTMTIASFICLSAGNTFQFIGANNLTYTVTNLMDIYLNSDPASLMNTSFGTGILNFGPSFVMYKDKRLSTVTNINTKYVITTDNTQGGTYLVFPANDPPGITFSNAYNGFNWSAGTSNGNFRSNRLTPIVYNIQYPTVPTTPAQFPDSMTSGFNVLLTDRAGGTPIEILSPFGVAAFQVNAYDLSPYVTTDASFFRTAGPSLKSLLLTRTPSYWKHPYSATYDGRAVKSIKIPVISGTSYTVSGYIQTNTTLSDWNTTGGACRMAIIANNNAEVTGQNMTTSCVGAWEQFTLTFTAVATSEYSLSWSMCYAASNTSFWLDDLTIV